MKCLYKMTIKYSGETLSSSYLKATISIKLRDNDRQTFSDIILVNNEIKKEYLAVVCGKPEKESDVLQDLLFKDSTKNKSFVVKRMRKGVKKASLEYKTLGSVNDEKNTLSLLKILLHTGRTHQIRVQFSSRKLPLLGDARYGGKSPLCDIALWSHSLTLTHPFTGEELHFEFQPPEEYPWNIF